MQKLGFGFMRLPQTDEKEVDTATVCKMVDTFLERGFTYFDTAYMYHNFKSEEILRETLVNRHERNKFTVADKLPVMMLKKKEDIERIFSEQLKKCGVDYFDFYLLHNITVEHYKTAVTLGAFEFIQQKKQEGLVHHIGFSYHDNAALLDEILSSHPEIDFVQIQLNYLDWESPSVQSRKCYETIVKHNRRVFVMEPVKGGTLAKVPADVERAFRRCHSDWSVPSWAIRFAAGLEHTDFVLSGMSDMNQLLDNTDFMRDFTSLNQSELTIIKNASDIINNIITIPCTGCRYCVDGCPKKIAIPEYFSLYNSVKNESERKFYVESTYYDNLCTQHGKASDCIQCKKCEKSCPQQLEITKYLKDVSSFFDAQ